MLENEGLNFCDFGNELQENKNIDFCNNGNPLCQAHAGNLFEHSQWTALQILDWFKEKNVLTEDLDIFTCMVSGFFHDIGKSGDCIYNLYDDTKYSHRGDSVHNEYSSDIILGNANYKQCCDKCSKINIPFFIKKYFKLVNINDIALAAYMHWEFGKLNIPKENQTIDERINIYIDTFIKYINKLNYEINIKLLQQLKLCIIIACADIAAGTNKNIKNKINFLSPEIYISYNPWKKFKMDKMYLYYRKLVINNFLNRFSIIYKK